MAENDVVAEKKVVAESNGQENNENGNNSDEITDLESAIIRQVEYYFGDSNLPRDRFLREQVKLDDGWVPLDVMTKFNRLAKLSTDTDVIANALNKSTSGLLEVSEDNKKVRRSPEMPIPEMNEERRKELMGRTIYAKGFPKDISLDELLKFFKGHGDVENIIMRRYIDRNTKKRLFKGSVFATFKVKDEAEKFLAKKGLKYVQTELILHWQADYIQLKQEEYLARKENKDKKLKKEQETKVKEEKEELKLPTGTVLHFSLENEKLTRENLKEALTGFGADIAYIDFKMGDKEGWVRLAKENTAKEIFDKIPDGKAKIADTEVTFKVLEGDDEKAYMDKTIEEMKKKRKNQKNNKYNKGKSFKGKQGRKRKQDSGEDEPPSKVKAES